MRVGVRKKEQEVFRAILYKPFLYPHLTTLQFTKHAHTLALWHKHTEGTADSRQAQCAGLVCVCVCASCAGTGRQD